MNIIADVGSNWKDKQHAFELIQKLSEIGINLIKFQLFNEDNIKDCPEYKDKIIDFEMAKELKEYGDELGVHVFFSCCYPEAIDFCIELDTLIKIRYKDRFNFELIDKVITRRNIISGVDLFCIPKYPAPLDEYPVYCGYSGYSDHTNGFELLKRALRQKYLEWFELHVKDSENCLEAAWSKDINELAEVLGNV